ncbi:MAG: alpha/beta fold hydrolase [Anaerolineales bacterium]
MIDATHFLFIHGSSGDKSQTYKARILRGIFPDMLTPDFEGDLPKRMKKLEATLGSETGWTLIGSSLGGLMAALFATQHPDQVRKLVLLAPALTLPEFAGHLPNPVTIPKIIVHGRRDDLLPLEAGRSLAEKVFTNLTYIVVDDNHRLHKAAEGLDWKELLA